MSSTFCLCCISEKICYMSDQRKIIVCNSLKLCKQSCQLFIQILIFLSSFTFFLKFSAPSTTGNLGHSQLLYPWKNGQCIFISRKLVDSSFFKMSKLQLETCKSLFSSWLVKWYLNRLVTPALINTTWSSLGRGKIPNWNLWTIGSKPISWLKRKCSSAL